MKILVIDKNPRLAERIEDLFSPHYVVDIAQTGEDGLYQAIHFEYCTIILGLKLPDIPGPEVCKLLRKKHVSTPLLILSCFDDPETIVKLLNIGADDYLTKPFDKAVLRARVNALARRKNKPYMHNRIIVDDLVIDSNSREVVRAGTTIRLRRKEFDILEYLIQNRGRTLSRDMIINHVWPCANDQCNKTVDVHIKRLRDKIDRPFKQPVIKTTYGVGYTIEGKSRQKLLRSKRTSKNLPGKQ